MELFFTTTIALTMTLGLAALGGLFSERSGVINIGIEGMMTAGALIWSATGVFMKESSNNSQLMAFILAGIFGSLIAMLHGIVSITLRGNQIISGTAINMLVSGIALFVTMAYQIGERPGQIASNYIVIGFATTGFWSKISILFLPVLIIFILSWMLLRKTPWGLRLRTIGENPIAAEAAGLNIITKRYQALAISGFLSGLAGGFFVQYTGGSFNGGVQGFGFLALGILIFGQWKVKYVGLATILFSLLSVFALIGKTSFNVSWLQKVPNELLQTLPFIASIAIMIISSKTMAGPQSLGVPYIKKRN